MAGGGRTLKAKAIRRCLVAVGRNRNAKIVWNTGFGAEETVVDAAEWAATQTWQTEDSV
jgi:hypothetical protein